MQPFTQTFEDTKYVFRGCITHNGRLYNGQKKKNKKNQTLVNKPLTSIQKTED
jgi:hypothetical protein